MYSCMLIEESIYVDYIMIIGNAKVKRAGPKPMIQCVLNAEQRVGNQVTGLVTSR